MEHFYRKKVGARKLLTKEKKRLLWGQDFFLWGKKTGRVFIMQIDYSFCGRCGLPKGLLTLPVLDLKHFRLVD